MMSAFIDKAMSIAGALRAADYRALRAHLEAREAEIAAESDAAREERDALRTRLEVSDTHSYDGIAARDATIQMLEKYAEEWKAERDALMKALRQLCVAFPSSLECNDFATWALEQAKEAMASSSKEGK